MEPLIKPVFVILDRHEGGNLYKISELWIPERRTAPFAGITLIKGFLVFVLSLLLFHLRLHAGL